MKRAWPQQQGEDSNGQEIPRDQEAKRRRVDNSEGPSQPNTLTKIRSEQEILHARSLRQYKRMQQSSNIAANLTEDEKSDEQMVLGKEVVDEETGVLKQVVGEELDGDAADGARRFDAQEGVMLEPFNLVAEREEGEFRDGFYVPDDLKSRYRMQEERHKKEKLEQERQFLEGGSGRRGKAPQKQNRRFVGRRNEEEEEEDEVDENGRRVQDAWADQFDHAEFVSVSGMSDRQKEAMEERKKREQEEHKRAQQIDPIVLKRRIVKNMHEQETVRDALERLQKRVDRDKKQNNGIEKRDSRFAKQFNELNELTIKLIGLGEYGIFDRTYEEMQKELDRFRERAMWMFKWDAQSESKTYGPYDTATMLAWQKAGHFRGKNVHVQIVHGGAAAAAANGQANVTDGDEDDMFADDEPVVSQPPPTTASEPFVPLQQMDMTNYK